MWAVELAPLEDACSVKAGISEGLEERMAQVQCRRKEDMQTGMREDHR